MKGLVLGWRVTQNLEPRYWLNPEAKPGYQSNDELIIVPSSRMDTHTIIVAQSGSGKSTFLGRLIEELLLKTKARCVILDPNADFRRADRSAPDDLWNLASYDRTRLCGKLPHEISRKEFSNKWSSLKIEILTLRRRGRAQRALKLWWPSLDAELLGEDLDPMLRTELYHCHSFTRAIGNLLVLRNAGKSPTSGTNPITEAEDLYRVWKQEESTSSEDEIRPSFKGTLDERYKLKDLLKSYRSLDEELAKPLGLPWYSDPEWKEFEMTPKEVQEMAENTIRRWLELASAELRHVSDSVGRFYFAKASEYSEGGIWARGPTVVSSPDARLKVIDLASFRHIPTRFLAVNSVLKQEFDSSRIAWERALLRKAENDERVPTFIVLDEAHNFIAAEPRGRAEAALREQFRTIAAEGRKYGLFLILVSQRPDKLDPFIISECENKALMRLNSESVLHAVQKMLGLEDLSVGIAKKCIQCEMGRVLLVGHWAEEGAQWMYCGARRTIEGGRSLRPDYWAVPYIDEGLETS